MFSLFAAHTLRFTMSRFMTYSQVLMSLEKLYRFVKTLKEESFLLKASRKL